MLTLIVLLVCPEITLNPEPVSNSQTKAVPELAVAVNVLVEPEQKFPPAIDIVGKALIVIS